MSDTLSGNAGQAQQNNVSWNAFFASLAVGAAIFGVEFLVWYFFRNRLTRIYSPKTYLVPERQKVDPPPAGWVGWITPIFHTSSPEFINKNGLDAYFFLRFLRMLLKIFVPLAVILLPILLPTNAVVDRGDLAPVTGLDQLGWQHLAGTNKVNRYWAHLILALVTIIYTCWVFQAELRRYVQVRQAYMTSPQHRLRASATTVLVSNIPRKWLTEEALDGLYDVFPGGIRNIWINRNYDELDEKVKLRAKLFANLEEAETKLISTCVKKEAERVEVERKKAGVKKSKSEIKKEKSREDPRAEELADKEAETTATSSGDPHQPHTVDEALDEMEEPGRDEHGQVQNADGLGLTIGRGGETPRVGFGREQSPYLDGSSSPHGHDASPSMRTSHEEKQPAAKKHKKFWKQDRSSMAFPSPQPHHREEDEYPLSKYPATPAANTPPLLSVLPAPVKDAVKSTFAGEKEPQKTKLDYGKPFDENLAGEDDDEAVWRKYIETKDRPTMRLPLINKTWFPALPLVGKKVDTIYHCRKELARLNAEIELDQQHPENFPLMNSAFIQFNQQVSAHMACQALAHHVPKTMNPRMVEISPDDVIWENLSTKWWAKYMWTAAVYATVAGLIILWAIPVTFTGALSKISQVANAAPWLNWINKLPEWFLSVIQGILPAALLGILLALLPITLRFLAKQQGVATGTLRELSVQNFYFFFLFVQVFLVVSISSGLTKSIQGLIDSPLSAPQVLAENLPSASTYFFSYMILQALSVSAGALVQIGSLVTMFLLSPLLDNTGRKQWRRLINMPNIQWGTFFPVYANLAVIGIIYCIITPLMVLFNIITFGLFWVVYRYQTLYVNRFTIDTGGLLFPRAINQLFVGLYFMELCLIGLFLITPDDKGDHRGFPQAIIMLIALICTIIYQFMLNEAFGPLYRYIPITMEDDAVKRDEEFARLHKWDNDGMEDDEETPKVHGEEINRFDGNAQSIEMTELDRANTGPRQGPQANRGASTKQGSWAKRSSHLVSRFEPSPRLGRSPRTPEANHRHSTHHHDQKPLPIAPFEQVVAGVTGVTKALPGTLAGTVDEEAQRRVNETLYGGYHDELEDLEPEERDALVRRAFVHKAARAQRPCVWIPNDPLGVAADEIARTARLSEHIWIANQGLRMDDKGKIRFSRPPSDFSMLDLIDL